MLLLIWFHVQFNTGRQIDMCTTFHQVGGHAAFLRFTENAVCKPLAVKEKRFYERWESGMAYLLTSVRESESCVHNSLPHKTRGKSCRTRSIHRSLPRRRQRTLPKRRFRHRRIVFIIIIVTRPARSLTRAQSQTHCLLVDGRIERC